MRAAKALAAVILLAGCQSQPPVLEAPIPQAQHRPAPDLRATPKRNADRQLKAIQGDIEALQRSLREEAR